MRKLTKEWMRKAEADYRLAVQIARGAEPFHDQLCFHSQQAAEKYLKALMQELTLVIPRTHILSDLLIAIVPIHPQFQALQRGMRFLTRFAVATRYPGESANKRQARSALRWAERVRKETRLALGIKPTKRKKKP